MWVRLPPPPLLEIIMKYKSKNPKKILDQRDGLVAAPNSHKVLLDNKDVRILEVTIKPGHKEPHHTHQLKSVMIVDQPTDIRYFNAKNKSKKIIGRRDLIVEWIEPEKLHAVENLDKKKSYHALRIELKK